MNGPPVPAPEVPRRTRVRRLDGACDRFEVDWVAGQAPRIEAYLTEVPEAERPALLREILALELELNHDRGERPAPIGEYRARFPGYLAEVEAVFAEADSRDAPGSSDASGFRRPGGSTTEPTAMSGGADSGLPNSLASTSAATPDWAWTPPAGDPPAGPTWPDTPAIPGYEILGVLGRGGMGVVYEALDRERGVRVALKSLPRADAAALARFKREFRARGDLAHPQLVPLFEMVSDGDGWFFTMEKVEGVSFLAYVRPPGADGRSQLDLPRLREALRQLTTGLIAVHDAGLLHRDLKPSNVVVRPDGRLVILDFGLVTSLPVPADGGDDGPGPHGPDSWYSAATDAFLAGTVDYMPPEVVAGERPSTAGDWYSVGVMVFEALVGRRPFSGAPERVLRDKRRYDPESPDELVAGLPEDLTALCEALVNRRPGMRPTGREILRRLGAAAELSPQPPASGASRPVLIGRDDSLAALRDAYRELHAGRPLTVLVHGRSGIGKSVLLQHVLGMIRREDDAVILAGRCFEQESVPYKAIDTLVDALASHLAGLPRGEADALLPPEVSALARIFPVLSRVPAIAGAPHSGLDPRDRHEYRRRAFAAWRALLGAIAARRPLVLAIDDLQWGDRDSALLLAELLRPPDPPGLMLLVSYRSEYTDRSECLRTFLGAIGRDGAVRRRELAIGPLTPAEARDLALAKLGRDDSAARAVAEVVARKSGGVPYFIHELVEHVRMRPDSAGEDVARLATTGRAIDLDGVLWSRIRGLPEPAHRLLEIIALAGQPLAQRWAFRAAGLEDGERSVLVALRSAKLVRSNGPRLDDEVEAFHDRIRESVVAHLDPEARRDRHRRLADVLEVSGAADPETLAVHHIGADSPEAAARYYGVAADRAAEALAFDRAARLYRLSDSLWPLDGEPGRALRRRLADALANAGRGVEAAKAYLAVAGQADGAERADLERHAAYQYCISGYVDAGRAAYREILGRIGLRLPGSPRRALLSLLHQRGRLRLRGLGFRRRPAEAIAPEELDRIDTLWESAVGLTMIDLPPGLVLQTRSLRLALGVGEPYRIVRSLAMLAANVSNQGPPVRRRVLRLLDSAESIGRHVDHPHARAMIALARGIAEFMVNRWRTSIEDLTRAEATLATECSGVSWEINTCRYFYFTSLVNLNEFPELRRRWAEGLHSTRARGDLYGQSVFETLIGTYVRLTDDDPEGAGRELRAIMSQWSRDGFHLQHIWELAAETLIALYLGDGRAAHRQVRARWAALEKSLFLKAHTVRDYLTYLSATAAVAAARTARDPGPLLASARRDVRRLRREGTSWASAKAELVSAGIEEVAGEPGEAARRYAGAAESLEACEAPVYAACARRRLGELVGGDNGRDLIAAAEVVLASRGCRDPIRTMWMYTG